MKTMRFFELSIVIQALAHAFAPPPNQAGGRFDSGGYDKAVRSAQRRHDRFYGNTSKYKPHESARAQRRYAARIAAKKIQNSEILRII